MRMTDPTAGLSEIGDGRLVKMEEDFTDKVDKAVPEAERLAEEGNLREALDGLYILEKQTRLAADMRSNGRVQVCIVQLCFRARDWEALSENIIALTKKRSLIKQAVAKMIQECCLYVDKMPDKESQLKLIETLRQVTAGKIYVEVERARLTYKLSQMQEAEGRLDEATQVLLDLQIETFGSMERREKVELLLEQMRLCLARRDTVRAQIISRKISVKFFEDPEHQTLKLKFYRQMIQMDGSEWSYLSICRHFLAIYDTPMIKGDPENLRQTLANVVVYAILAPHSNEQWDLLQRIKRDKNLEQVPTYRELIQMFTTQELISWRRDILGKYEQVLKTGQHTAPPTGVFDPKTEEGRKRWEDFAARVGEHDLRTVAKYYTRIRLGRMAELLDWPVEKTEEFLCQLVVDGTIPGAKIDRPAGVVHFRPPRSCVETLDEWVAGVRQLTDLLNKASHLILKEEMVHKHLHGLGAPFAPTNA